LEDKIRSSDYFLVLNSQALVEKKVGYVNKEIGRLDLKRFQQIPLRRGLFDDDVSQIVKTIFRDHQLRMR
jgi:hypothetical protein